MYLRRKLALRTTARKSRAQAFLETSPLIQGNRLYLFELLIAEEYSRFQKENGIFSDFVAGKQRLGRDAWPHGGVLLEEIFGSLCSALGNIKSRAPVAAMSVV